MDKSDIYWCLNPEVFAEVDLTNIVDGGIWNGLSVFVMEGMISFAKKNRLIEQIQFIIKNAQNYTEIDAAIFDYIMREYAWHMGETYYKMVKPFGFLKNIWRIIKGGDIDQPYCKVPQILASYAYVIITNVYDLSKKITKEEYIRLIKKYCLRTHVLYERIQSPTLYPYKGFLLEILIKNVATLEDYYKKKYKDTHLDSFEADYVKIFYARIKIIPVGDDSAYPQ